MSYQTCCQQLHDDLAQIISDLEDERQDFQVALSMAMAAEDWDLVADIQYEIEVTDTAIALANAEDSGVSSGCGCCS